MLCIVLVLARAETAEVVSTTKISQEMTMIGYIAQVSLRGCFFMRGGNMNRSKSLCTKIENTLLTCILMTHFIESAKSLYHPIDQNHQIYTSCEDASARGGIRLNPGEPIAILLSDGTSANCTRSSINQNGETLCPSGMYGKGSKCFTVHDEYVGNMEASRYCF